MQPLLQQKSNNSIAYTKSVCVCVCVCVAFGNQHPTNAPKFFLRPIQIVSSMVQF
jgi:hypothetical protein